MKKIIIVSILILIFSGCSSKINYEEDREKYTNELSLKNEQLNEINQEIQKKDKVIQELQSNVSRLSNKIDELTDISVRNQDNEVVSILSDYVITGESVVILNNQMVFIDSIGEIVDLEVNTKKSLVKKSGTICDYTSETIEFIEVDNLSSILKDNYNFIKPKLVGNNSLVYFVRSKEIENNLYLCQYNLSTGNNQIIYTLETTEADFKTMKSKVTDDKRIYIFERDFLIYDIGHEAIVRHYRYNESIINDPFDVSINGEYICFKHEGNLLVSDINMKNSLIIAKGKEGKTFDDGMTPRYPVFSGSNTNLLSFSRIGCGLSYGDVIYNINDNTCTEVTTTDLNIEWISDELLLVYDSYENQEIDGLIVGTQYFKFEEIFNRYYGSLDMNIINEIYGIPLYDKNLSLCFFNLKENTKKIVDGLEPKEILVSISYDGQYILTRKEPFSNKDKYYLYKVKK